ncbi:hypothetical protein F4811DRAFT_357026 [Daldinia bambusicola]|nr:hypothetical protein F4811DRAFT_357026 [Daldinia bambusicola]
MATRLIVRYPKRAMFDFEYYAQSHVPKALTLVKPAGMESYLVEPEMAESPYGAVFEVRWPSFDACRKALMPAPTPEITPFLIDDVKNYSVHVPEIFIMTGDVVVANVEIQRGDPSGNGSLHRFVVKEEMTQA